MPIARTEPTGLPFINCRIPSQAYCHHIRGSCSAHPLCGASIGISACGSVTEPAHAPEATSSSATFTDELPISIPNVYTISLSLNFPPKF